MKNVIISILSVFLLLGCNHTKDAPIAKVFHHNLYFSEVLNNTPFFTSKEDSLLFMEQYIDEWIMRKTLLSYAKKSLSQKEQNFNSKIELYKEQLLINEYLQKIIRDSSLYLVTNNELTNFLNKDIQDETPEYREMVKLNYIKLSVGSKHNKKVKELFFDVNNRVNALKQLEILCADTIEYYLDSEHWFYVDFIENELLFPFSEKIFFENKEQFEFIQGGYRYYVVILDKKRQLQTRNAFEDRKMAISLLQQEKKTSFYRNFQDSLVRKSLSEKNVFRFGLPNY